MSVSIYRIEYHSTNILNDRELVNLLFDKFGKEDGTSIYIDWEEFKEWFAQLMQEDPEIFSRDGNQDFWTGLVEEFEKECNRQMEKYYISRGLPLPESPMSFASLDLSISW